MPERKTILRNLAAALALYVAAFAIISYGGISRSALTVGGGAIVLAVAAVLLQVTFSRARKHGLLAARVRRRIALGMILVGIALGAAWLAFKPGGGLGLSGLCAAYLGLGQLLAEWRTHRGKWRGAVICGACAVAFAAGLALSVAVTELALAASALALLAGPIGLSLLSEDVTRRTPRLTWLALPAGLLVALAGVLLLRAAGLAPEHAAWLAVALLVLVGAIASSTQADVLLVVTAVALAWTTIPAGQAPGRTVGDAGGRSTLASLGDSYMSGEGAGDYFEDTNHADVNECRRAPTAYAHEVVDERRAGTIERLAFFACSGAETTDLHPRPQYPGEPVDDTPERGESQVAQLEARQRRGGIALVIVSVGGNDAGFSKIGMACLAPGSCVERGQLWLDELPAVGDRVERSYRRIRRAVDYEVPVLAVPYPQPIRATSCPSSLLEDDEHRFLHGFVGQLNRVIRQAAGDAKVHYLTGMPGAFGERMRICDGSDSDRGVNFIALKSVNGLIEQALDPAKWIHNSLHPNETGHDAMAAVLERWLAAHPDPPVRPRPGQRPAAVAPASLEDIMGTPVRHCDSTTDDDPDHCDREPVPWALTQVAYFVAGAAIPALVLVAGCWLAWLPVLARTRDYWADRVR